MRTSLLFALAIGCSSSSPSGGAAPQDAGADAIVAPDVTTTDVAAETAAAKTDNELLTWTSAFHKTEGDVTNLQLFTFVADPGKRCATKTVGPCRVVDCADDGTTVQALSAGTIALKAGGVAVLQNKPNASGIYEPKFATTELWKEGATLVFSAPGADLPPIAVTLTAPPIVPPTDPAPDSNPILERGKDFTAKWATTTGKVGVWISQAGSTNETSRRLMCTYDGAAGTGVVPGAALDALQTTAALMGTGLATAFSVGGLADADVPLAPYKMHAFALNGTTFLATVQ